MHQQPAHHQNSAVPASLLSIGDSLKRAALVRRARAEKHVLLHCGPGHTDNLRVIWQRVEGGDYRRGTLLEFLSVAADADRVDVEIGLHLNRQIIADGFVVCAAPSLRGAF